MLTWSTFVVFMRMFFVTSIALLAIHSNFRTLLHHPLSIEYLVYRDSLYFNLPAGVYRLAFTSRGINYRILSLRAPCRFLFTCESEQSRTQTTCWISVISNGQP